MNSFSPGTAIKRGTQRDAETEKRVRPREEERETRRTLYRSLNTRGDRLGTEHRPFSWSLPHHKKVTGKRQGFTAAVWQSLGLCFCVNMEDWLLITWKKPERKQQQWQQPQELCGDHHQIQKEKSMWQTSNTGREELQRYSQTVPGQPRESGLSAEPWKVSHYILREAGFPILFLSLCVVDMADGEKEATQKDGKSDPCKSKDLRDSWWIKSLSWLLSCNCAEKTFNRISEEQTLKF